MNLKEYFNDLHQVEARLEKVAANQGGIVFVTSVFHREKNSTPGSTMSATPRNAARVITDGTHREATPEEVQAFYDRQREELQKNTKMEQAKKQQYIVVVDQHQPSQAAFMPPVATQDAPMPAPPAPAVAPAAKSSDKQ